MACARASSTIARNAIETSPRCSTAPPSRAKVSQGVLDQFLVWSMQCGSRTRTKVQGLLRDRFHRDLKKFDVRHWCFTARTTRSFRSGTRDEVGAAHQGAKDVYYPGAPHGITATHQDQSTPSCSRSFRARRHSSS